MANFDIKEFGDNLKEFIANSIPIEPRWLAVQKHSGLKKNQRNPLQLHQQVKSELSKPLSPINQMSYYFDLGSERLEAIYPYYHILEDSEVIHKRGKGTTTSKGSQAKVGELGKRDYGRVERKIVFKDGRGKTTYYQEYRKNVRGKRSALKKETFREYNVDTGEIDYVERVVGTKSSTTYYNKDYHYIERNLESWVIPTLVSAFHLKQKRTKISDLAEGQYEFWLNQFNL